MRFYQIMAINNKLTGLYCYIFEDNLLIKDQYDFYVKDYLLPRPQGEEIIRYQESRVFEFVSILDLFELHNVVCLATDLNVYIQVDAVLDDSSYLSFDPAMTRLDLIREMEGYYEGI